MLKKRNAYTLFLVCLFTCALTLISYIALTKIKTATTQNIKNSLLTLILTIQETHHLLVEQRRFAIETIASTPIIIESTEQILKDHQQGKDTKLSPALAKLKLTIGPILKNFQDQGFIIISPDNINIATMLHINIGDTNLIHKQRPELLARAFQGESVFIPPIVSDVPLTEHSIRKKSAEQTMFITTPIRNFSNEIIAVLAMRINPMVHFSSITTIGRIGQTGETYGFDKEGNLLTKSRYIEDLKKINMIESQNTFNIKIVDPGGNIVTGYQSKFSQDELPLTYMAQQATQGINGVNVEGYRDYRGISVFGAWVWDREFSFGIATEINESEALAPYYQMRQSFIVIVALTLLLGLFMLRVIINTQQRNRYKILKINAELENRVIERTQDLIDAKEKLSQANIELATLATTDALTGIANRRHFDEKFEREWRRCKRDQKSIAILLFDIDFFKQYNDHYGHLKGDKCLKSISNFLLDSHITKRPGDIVARYGGEEFILLLSDTNAAYTLEMANAICNGIRDLNISHEKSALKNTKVVTVSVGYYMAEPVNELKPNQLINRADNAMYRAKHLGRNRVCKYCEDFDSKITTLHRNKVMPSP